MSRPRGRPLALYVVVTSRGSQRRAGAERRGGASSVGVSRSTDPSHTPLLVLTTQGDRSPVFGKEVRESHGLVHSHDSPLNTISTLGFVCL